MEVINELNLKTINTSKSFIKYIDVNVIEQFIEFIKNTTKNKILCLYDFNTVNNLGIVYDESKNTNFLEKVPKEFVK